MYISASQMDFIMESTLFPMLTYFSIGPANNLLQNTIENAGWMLCFLAWYPRLFFMWPLLTSLANPLPYKSHCSHHSWDDSASSHTSVFMPFLSWKAFPLPSPPLPTFTSSLETQLDCLPCILYVYWILDLSGMKLLYF